MNFIDYSKIGFEAYLSSSKQEETRRRKKEIITAVFSDHRSNPRSFLFIGFNPAMLEYAGTSVTVTQCDQDTYDQLQTLMPGVSYIDWEELDLTQRRWDAVVAMDEFLTFVESEDQQNQQLGKICGLAGQTAITTLKDYKNLGFKDREFSMPSVVKGEEVDRIYLEYNDYDIQDRNSFSRSVYEIEQDRLRSWRGFACRQMFFKQCAKFSIDAGAAEFLIHKNIMYKSLIKKNYEHVISMRFDNGTNYRSR
jgi:hypothetical protein